MAIVGERLDHCLRACFRNCRCSNHWDVDSRQTAREKKAQDEEIEKKKAIEKACKKQEKQNKKAADKAQKALSKSIREAKAIETLRKKEKAASKKVEKARKREEAKARKAADKAAKAASKASKITNKKATRDLVRVVGLISQEKVFLPLKKKVSSLRKLRRQYYLRLIN